MSSLSDLVDKKADLLKPAFSILMKIRELRFQNENLDKTAIKSPLKIERRK
jgi:hypothetical protein